MKIKIIIVNFIIILCTQFLYSQDNFEGTIEYEVDFKMLEGFKKLGLSYDDFISRLKLEGNYFTTVKYHYKNGNYLFEPFSNNSSSNKQLYVSKKNKVFYFDDDLIVESDASVDLETVKGKTPKVELLNTIKDIGGVNCKAVKVTWKSSTFHYYYHSDLFKMDSNLFSEHNYDMWYQYLKISNALPVQIVKEINGIMITTFTMKNYEIKNISSTLFELPPMKEDFELGKYSQSHEKIYVRL